MDVYEVTNICPILQQSVDVHTVPALWTKSIVFLLAKKLCPTKNNDFRLVALTSIVMKGFEKYMMSVLKTEVNLALDPFQFVYRQERGTDEAINNPPPTSLSSTYKTLKPLQGFCLF